MQLAHAGDDGLAGLLVRRDAERRVLVRELSKRDAHFLLVRLRFRLNAQTHDRFGEFYFLKHDGIRFITKRVRRLGVFEPDGGGNLASEHFFDFFALVGLEAHDAANALLGARRRVVHV